MTAPRLRHLARALALTVLVTSCGPDPGPPPGPNVPPRPSGSGRPDFKTMKVGPTADPSLPPRKLFFDNPDRTSPRLSPDGTRIGFLAPKDGVLNVWVGPADDPKKAKVVTDDKVRGIRGFSWAYTNKHVLYSQDDKGDENWHVYSADVDTLVKKDLTPIPKVRAEINGVSYKSPKKILVGMNDRDPKAFDIYEIDIDTGGKKLLEKNTERFVQYVFDPDYKTRAAARFLPTGGIEIVRPAGKDKWTAFVTIAPEDAMSTNPVATDKTGKTLYMLDSRGRDLAAVTAVDIATGETKVVVEADKADIRGILLHPTERTVQAVRTEYERARYIAIDDAVKSDIAVLGKETKGDLEILGASMDDSRWIVADSIDDGPARYYLFDRKKKEKTFLFTNRDALEGKTLARMRPVIIPAHDKKPLVSYLSLPRSADPDGDAKVDKPLPMVLFVHGGPWARDSWGLNGTHQWLASRGYAVLSVNYRGSTGFGKGFINAADKEWAGAMHQDLVSAVEWAVREKIADKDRVAIMGASYGGYSTLVGLTFTPKTFACGVDIVGPSNLVTLLQNVPPYWVPMLPMMTTRVGDPNTEDGKKFLLSRSPLTRVAKIERPLLIGQGANDPRVKQAESDQIVKAMQEKQIPVTYVLYPDEGHGFARPENRMSFNAVAEAFLAQCLSGTYLPVGDDFKGASITVPAGADQVIGLVDALPKP